MAKSTPAAASADDFDDLLGPDEPVAPEPSVPEVTAPETDSFDDLVADDEPTLTAEQLRIQELEAALADLDAAEDAELELTPEQKRIAELEALLAEKEEARFARQAPTEAASAASGDKILFHFKKDGLLVLGNIWLRGQEVEIEVGSPAYQRTLNANGESWLDLLGDEAAQYEKWGDHYIGSGPFIPRRDEKFEDEVAKEDTRRRRRPITLST